jgi:hypothetical protein
MLPGLPSAKIYARLIMSPMGAKLFYRALAENLARYEANFGEIPTPEDGTLANDLFGQVLPPKA